MMSTRLVWTAALAAASLSAVSHRLGAQSRGDVADYLSAPKPSSLVPAPDGRAVAWIGDEEGRRNVWIAEAPAWRARRLTRTTADDGQPLSALTWTGDGRGLLFVRGGAPGSNWDSDLAVNPTSDPAGGEQAVWLVTRAGAMRRIGDGHGPVSSPSGDRVVFARDDTLLIASLRRAAPAQVLFRIRGASSQPEWSPDGSRVAFVSRRGDHSFVGVYDLAARAVTWMAPATRRDDVPRFSPDGTRIAFIRREGGTFPGGAPAAGARGRPQPPFTIMVAAAATGEAREAWSSPAGPDGSFPGLAGDWALMWAGADHLLFASEQTGWLGLYRVPAQGGDAVRLTPTGCEIRDVRVTSRRDTVVYASNCDDVDRMHVQKVAVAGGAPVAVTGGPGLEWAPAPLADGRTAVLRSDARRPASPAFAADVAPLAGWPLPAAFPLADLVVPEQVVVTAADSTAIHLQVFLPPAAGSVRRPAVLFFHGGPRRQMLLGWHDRGYYHNAYALNQYLASRGFVVVSVNYRGGIGYGRAFREAPRRGRAGASEYLDVLAAAAWLRGRPDVDSARIGLWGGSYGGYLTALGLARNSDLFAAGVDLHGVHDYSVSSAQAPRQSDSAVALARRSSPVGGLATWRSPVLLIAGDDDRNVQFQQTTDLAMRLRRQGVRVEELVFPDDIHGFLLHRNWVAAYRAAARFFEETLGRR